MTTAWTYTDLAELTERANQIAQLIDVATSALSTRYCENCKIVHVKLGEKYCDGCVEDVVAYLAMYYQEQSLTERGLY